MLHLEFRVQPNLDSKSQAGRTFDSLEREGIWPIPGEGRPQNHSKAFLAFMMVASCHMGVWEREGRMEKSNTPKETAT